MMGKKQNNVILGAHFSISKGLHDAVYQAKAYDCNALQMFTKNATTWRERIVTKDERTQFMRAKKETGIQTIASHTSYLINLASPDSKKYAMSCHALKQELIRSSALHIPYCILHPGAHMDSGIDMGLSKIAESINEIFLQTTELSTRLLLETTAGQGSSLGHTFEQLSRIIDTVDRKDRIGVCLDTCHIFAAGYDIRTEEAYRRTMAQFHSILGLDQLYVIHFNDSRKDLGSRVDRHAHIGNGAIGLDAFKYFLNDEKLAGIPKLLETPKGDGTTDWDKKNLNLLRSLVV